MMNRQSGRTLYAVAIVALAVALVAAAVRAQSASFTAKRNEIRRQAAADRAAAQLNGDANRRKLFSQFPTPEVTLAKPVVLAAGASGPVSLVGKFSDKTTFVSYTEGVELSNVVVAANSFKATVTVAAGLSLGWGRIFAFAPVSEGEVWVPAVFIGTPRTYNLTAANGWTIKLAPQAQSFAFTKPGAATATYKADFFKPGAATPFESTSGPLEILAESQPGSYTFMMSAGQSGSAMAELPALQEQMMALIKAGKAAGPEMTALQKKIEVVSARMTKELQAQLKDPAAMQKKQDDFGCETISLWTKAGQVSGNINCGKNVGTLDFTGR